MPNILARIKTRIDETPVEESVKVITDTVPGASDEIVADIHQEEIATVQPILSTKLLKKIDPGVPTTGFTLSYLAEELGRLLEKAMHKNGVSSIEKSSLGLIGDLGITPSGFELIMDENIGVEFYVLKNSNRMTEVFRSMVKALSSTNSDRVSFPYTVKWSIDLPISYNVAMDNFDYRRLEITSLCMTPTEIENLNYKFIKEIQFCETNPEIEGSSNLLVMEVDREEWKAAPFRV